jgi:hypothetical protein
MATERVRQKFQRGCECILTWTSEASREALTKSTSTTAEEHVEEIFWANFSVETSPTELLCSET